RDHQNRLRAVTQTRVGAGVEGVRSVRWNHVRVVQVEDIARESDVAREAQLTEIQRLGLEATAHLLVAQLLRELVVLDDGKAKQFAVAEEQGPGLCPREPTGLRQAALEQGLHVLLAGQGDPDLHQIPERLGQIQRRSPQELESDQFV